MLTRPDRSLWWSVTREWQGETAFVVGGGPSVLKQDLEALRGRRVVAINSSYARVPFADILLFGDLRWWIRYRSDIAGFAGRIVTCRNTPCDLKSASGRQVLTLERQRPPGLASLPTRLVFRRTSYTAAINLLVHLGVIRIVALGLDGKPDDQWIRSNGEQGLSHHHGRPHWKVRPGCWKEQRADLASLVTPLKQAGVEMLNASPGSALDLWPQVNLEQVL